MMESGYKISVVTAAYNEEKYIEKCIKRLLNQTLKPDEIIIVDDGSTDKTYEICQKYPVKVFRKEHSGVGHSRNFGVSKVSGDIVVFFDADMYAPPDYLQKPITPIIQGKAIGTGHADELVANSENRWSRCWCIEWRVSVGRRIPKPRSGYGNEFRATRKDVFIKVGGFDEKKGYCDNNLGEKNIKSLYVEDCLCYQSNPSSLNEVFESTVWVE